MRLTVFGFLFLVFSSVTFAQQNYRTRASGNWNDPAVWQIETSPGSWSIAMAAPDFTQGSITLRGGHYITVTGNLIIDQTVIASSATLDVQDGVLVTVNNGLGTDFWVYAGGNVHLRGESALVGSGSMTATGNFYVYSTNSLGAIAAGTSSGGNIQLSSRNWRPGCNIYYVGTQSQYIGNGHPGGISSTVIQNQSGVQFNNTSTSSVIIGGIIRVEQGELRIENNTLTSSGSLVVNGGSVLFVNSTINRRHILNELLIQEGSVQVNSASSSQDLTLDINTNLNLIGGGLTLQSGTGRAILQIYGDVSGIQQINSSGTNSYVRIFGTGDFTHESPFAVNATFRYLIVDRPGLILSIQNPIGVRWFYLYNGNVILNTDLEVTTSLCLAMNTTFDFSGHTLTINGLVNDLFSGGNFISDDGSSMEFTNNSASPSSISFSNGSSLGSLILNNLGAVTLTSPVNINNTLNLTRSAFINSGTLNMANGSTIIRDAGCSFTGSAPTGGPYSVSYTGTSLTTGIEAQGSLNNLTSSLSGTLTVNTPLNLAGDLTINSGTFTSGTHAISANDFFSDGLFNAPSSTLSLSGNLTNNGPFNANNGEVILNGGATQNISGTSLIQFNDLTLATGADVSIESNQNLRGVLTLNDNATLDADGSSESAIFTVLSVGDAAGSDGSIAALGTGASVIGDISVQRYWGVEDNDYRYISSPVANGTLQQLIDANILITGYPGSPFPCGGDCNNDNANLSHYDETLLGTFQNGWTDFPGPAGDASATFVPGRGYGLYMWNGTQPTLWTSRGTLNQGTMIFDISHTPSSPAEPSADGWNLVGNPYASSIRWEDNAELPGGWTFGGNVSPTVWIYDEVAEVWRSYNRNSNAGNFDGVIATGQAFWVQVTSADANATLEVHEAAKTGNSGAYYRTTTVNPMFIISLSQGDFEDQVFAILQDEANTKKFSLGKERMSLAFLGDEGDRFAYYSLNESSDNMPLSIRVREAGDYTLQLSTKGVDGYFIVDKLLNKTIPASESYSFTVLAGNQTINDRFIVTRTPGALPQIREDVLIEAYPNPVVSQLTIRVGGEVERIDIMNSVGQTFASIDSELVTFVDGVSTAEVSLDDLQQGVYIVRVVKSDRSVYIRKILKR